MSMIDSIEYIDNARIRAGAGISLLSLHLGAISRNQFIPCIPSYLSASAGGSIYSKGGALDCFSYGKYYDHIELIEYINEYGKVIKTKKVNKELLSNEKSVITHLVYKTKELKKSELRMRFFYGIENTINYFFDKIQKKNLRGIGIEGICGELFGVLEVTDSADEIIYPGTNGDFIYNSLRCSCNILSLDTQIYQLFRYLHYYRPFIKKCIFGAGILKNWRIAYSNFLALSYPDERFIPSIQNVKKDKLLNTIKESIDQMKDYFRYYLLRILPLNKDDLWSVEFYPVTDGVAYDEERYQKYIKEFPGVDI
jgi:hypothetical protein